MPYLLDYLENQFATFDEQPLNVVDAAVLSQMCMVNGKGMIPGLKDRSSFTNVFTFLQDKFSPSNKPVRFVELLQAENFRDMFTGLDPARIKKCLFATAASPRFRNMVVRDYINLFDAERELQFAAMSFVQNDDFAVVTFRGTDSSITGWKEDFNMAYSAPVPAQEQALQYLQAAAGNLPEKIYLCGHSKGGNLAEYAALKASPEIQQRIAQVFILDGPGFKEGFFGSSQYAPIIDRMYKVVPQDSIIGILLDSPVPLHIVPSNAKGFNQHSVFTWEIAVKPIELEAGLEIEDQADDKFAFLDRIRTRDEGESISKAILEELAEGDEAIDYEGIMGCDFVYLENISDNSSFVSETLRRWLGRYDDKEREGVIDALFRMLEATGADDVLEILSGGAKTLNMFADAAAIATDEDKDLIVEAGKDFAETASGLAAARMGKAAAQSVKSGMTQLKEAAQAAAEKRRLAKELQTKELQAADPADEA